MALPAVGAAGTTSSSTTGAGYGSGARERRSRSEPSSALDARGSNALHEVALEEDVDQQYRQRSDDDGCHEWRPVGAEASGQPEHCQSERQRCVRRILEEHDRPEERALPKGGVTLCVTAVCHGAI